MYKIFISDYARKQIRRIDQQYHAQIVKAIAGETGKISKTLRFLFLKKIECLPLRTTIMNPHESS